MGKLNTYELKGTLEATLQLIGIIPGVGSAFETVRLSNAALIAFVEQYAGVNGTDGKQVELRKGSTNIEWKYTVDSTWNALIPIADLKGNKGDAGEAVQLQKSSTAIQWKYASATDWTDLVLLSALKGVDGVNGRTMWSTTGAPSPALGLDGDFANDSAASMMYGPKAAGSWGAGTSYKGVKGDTGTGLRNRGAWVTGTTYTPGDYVFSTGSSTSSSMWILNGAVDYVSSTLPKDDPTKWVEFVAPAGANGVDGKNVEMRKTSTLIQWRLVGNPDWIDLVTLADLKGAQGDPGTTGAAGKTMLSTVGVPSNGVGVDGDFNNDSTNFVMYGPKSGGVWPAGKIYKGTNGTDGAAGAKWLTGSVVPAAGTGVNGDFYLRDNGDVYGPKAAGAWGSVVASLKGVTGNPGNDGAGVPTGGTAGQVLAKVSSTNFATNWVTPSSGGGGGDATLAGAQTFTGLKTFSGGTVLGGVTEIAGGTVLYSAAVRKTGLSNGGTMVLTAGVSQQVISMAAALASATFTFPNDPLSGLEVTIYLEKEITSATFNGGTMWGGSQVLSVIGAPTLMKAGGHKFRMVMAETPNWYYIN